MFRRGFNQIVKSIEYCRIYYVQQACEINVQISENFVQKKIQLDLKINNL